MSLVAAPDFLTLVKIVFYPASTKYFLSLLFSSAIAKKVLSGDAVFLTITADLFLLFVDRNLRWGSRFWHLGSTAREQDNRGNQKNNDGEWHSA